MGDGCRMLGTYRARGYEFDTDTSGRTGEADFRHRRSRNLFRLPLVVSCSVLVGCRKSILMIQRYGYHVPAVRRRDIFYSKLEDERAANASA
jgi:cytochrome c oxidase subunit 7